MAITKLNLGTLAPEAAGYPAYVAATYSKLSEVADAMTIAKPIFSTIAAAKGDPAGDITKAASTLDIIIDTLNGVGGGSASAPSALVTQAVARRDVATIATGLTAVTNYEVRETSTGNAVALPTGSRIVEGKVYLPILPAGRAANARSIRVAAASNGGTPGAWVTFADAVGATSTDQVFYFGFGDSNAGENSSFPGVGKSYNDLLRSWYTGNGRGTYLSFGFGGAGLGDVVGTQFGQADAYVADHPSEGVKVVAMISIGTNNGGIALADFQAGMLGIRDACIARGWPFVLCSFIEPFVQVNGGPSAWAVNAHDDLRLRAVGTYRAFDYWDFRSDYRLRYQVDAAYASSHATQASTEYFRLDNGTVDGQGFHIGPLGHAVEFVERQVYYERLLTAPAPTLSGNSVPIAPGISADDTANTLRFTHVLGASEIVVSVNDATYVAYAAVPGYNPGTGQIEIGDITVAAGYYKAKIKAAAGRDESPVINSPAFTKGAPVGRPFERLSFNDPSISENGQYAGQYQTYLAAAGSPPVPFRSTPADPLLYYRWTGKFGIQLITPLVSECDGNFMGGLQVAVDNVQQPNLYYQTPGVETFNFQFNDGADHTVQWYNATSGQTNLYKFNHFTQ